MDPKIRHVSIFFDAGFLYTVLIASCHHHPDLVVHPDCAICKLAQGLQSADEVGPHSMMLPFFILMSIVSHRVINRFSEITVSVITRAPPALIPSLAANRQGKEAGTGSAL
jgi:hypothetical protein